MNIRKAIIGGFIVALASSSLAVADCTSYCMGQCGHLVGREMSLCLHKCFNQSDQCVPIGN